MSAIVGPLNHAYTVTVHVRKRWKERTTRSVEVADAIKASRILLTTSDRLYCLLRFEPEAVVFFCKRNTPAEAWFTVTVIQVPNDEPLELTLRRLREIREWRPNQPVQGFRPRV
jgi:hypothetical protein